MNDQNPATSNSESLSGKQSDPPKAMTELSGTGYVAPLLLQRWALVLIIISLIIHLLTFARELLIPITYGFFLSSLLFLPTRALKLLRLPEILAAFLSVSIFASAIAGVVYVSKDPAFDMAHKIPGMVRSIKQELVGMTSEMKVVASNAEEIKEAVDEVIQQDNKEDGALVVVDKQQQDQEIAYIADAAFTFVLSLVVAFFFLVGGDVLSRNIGSLYHRRAERLNFYHFQRTLRETLAHYLMVVCIINTVFGVIVGFTLWLFDINDFQILGGAGALLRFIPFAGQLVTLSIVATAGYSQTGDLGTVVLILFIIISLLFIFGNFIDPIVHAKNLKLNPIAIFLFLLLWGWVWGVAGVFIAIPALVCFAVLCRHTRSLYPLYAIICVEKLPSDRIFSEAERKARTI